MAAITKVTRATRYPENPPQLAAMTKMAVKTSRAKVMELGRFKGKKSVSYLETTDNLLR